MAEPLRPVDHPVIRQFSSILRRGIQEDLSSRALIRSMRGVGGQIRDATAFAAIADLRERVRLETNLRFLNFNQRPNPNRLPESLTPLLRQFSFTVGINPRTVGNRVIADQVVTVTSDTLLTRQEIEDMARTFPEQNYGIQSFTQQRFQLLGGRRTAGGTVL